jgi:hypothetical protein
MRALQSIMLATVVSFSVHAQDQAQPQSLDHTLTSLHGIVRNAVTGDGVPRVLVRVEGDASTGALTDGDGRFAIPNIPVGPQHVGIVKPGYLDVASSTATALSGNGSTFLFAPPNGGHNVMVAADMPDVIFTLSPTGAIRGQVELSTGDSAQGVTLSLAQRVIQMGRAVWQSMAVTKVQSDGSFRFGNLADGDYSLYSAPAMDSDLDEPTGPAGAGQRWGFAAYFYPDAREPSGVSAIHVANGQQAQANLTLSLEPFQPVNATVSFPQGVGAGMGMEFSAVIADSIGRQLPYQAQYDADSRMIHADLPDGNYTLLVTGASHYRGAGSMQLHGGVLAGSVDFVVAGRPVPNLRCTLSSASPSPVDVTAMHNTGQAMGSGPLALVTVSSAQGWVDDSMVSEFASGNAPGPLRVSYTRPGSYWVAAHVQQKGFCEAALTAGGANLAREPLVIGASGSSLPMALTLRDDCASLQISLPDSDSSIAAGDEQSYTVYVVPDFDSTSEVQRSTLRASTGGTITVANLTPGNYHVYTFPGFVEFAYRNREALQAMSSRAQAVTLAPSATASLEVVVAEQ